MKCEICGSGNNVRAFYGYIRDMYYAECYNCYRKIMKKSINILNGDSNSDEVLDKLWNDGLLEFLNENKNDGH